MRKMTAQELTQFNTNITNVINGILNVAQVKASLRLMRDEEGIDKELLDYANRALNQQMMNILQTSVPHPQKRRASIEEQAEKLNDATLESLTKDSDWRFSVGFMGEIPLSQCDVEDGGEVGQDYLWGVRGRGVWLLIKKKRGTCPEIWCDRCSWSAFDLHGDTTTVSCPKCQKKLMEKVPNELNSMR